MFFKHNDDQKSLTKVQRRQFIEKMLDEDFPLVSVSISVIINVLLGATAIGFHVASIVFSTEYYYTGCG